MDKKAFLEKSLDIQIACYKSRRNATNIIDKVNPMLSSIVRELYYEFNEIQDLTLDVLEIPETKTDDKYRKECFERSVIRGLMDEAVCNPDKYKEAFITIALDWKNIQKYTESCETHTWFYHRHVLDEFIKPSIKEKKTTKKSTK